MQVGHSHRVAGAFEAPGPTILFEYVCETGFESRRRTHRWMVAARESRHECSRATLNTEDWLCAAVASQADRRLLIPSPDGAKRRVAVVRDDTEWAARLDGDVGRWLGSQPSNRSWEVMPGYVVGYQPGPLNDAGLADLAEAGAELDARLCR